MPRKIKPKLPEQKDQFRIERPQSPSPVETGDPWKDGPIWQSRLTKTLNMRMQSDNGDRHWTAYWNWFNGRQWQYEDTGKGGWELYSDTIRGVYTNNIVQGIASGYMPFLLNGEIKFKVKPQRPQDVNAATLQTAILNYEWREREMTEEVKKVIDDVVIIGHGIGKTGYVVEVDEARKKRDGKIEYRDYVKKDAAFIERVSPLDFIFDLSAKDGTLKTARWCAERTYVPLPDLVANPKYDKKVTDVIYSGGGSYTISMRSGFAAGSAAADALFGKEMMAKVPEDSLVAVWEIWDKKHRQRIVMAEGLPFPLMTEDWPYDYLDSFPYVMIPFLRAPGLLYPIGVARQLKDSQLQTNRIRTQQVQNVRAQKNMYGYLKGQVDKEDLQDFADLPALSAIGMERPDALFNIPNPPMNRDALILEQSIAADARQQTGADALFQGQQLPDRTTAAEIGTRTNLVRLKADDKISNVERGVTDLARQVLQHLKAHRVQDDVIEIAGLLGSQWQTYTAEEIQAETDVDVSYFAAPKYDPALERQQKLQVLQLVVQALPVLQQTGAAQTVDMTQLLAWLLLSFDDIKDAGRFFKPALTVQPPLQEQPPGAGEGLPPALAGGLAPGAVPTQPTNGGPPGAPSAQDLLMQIMGQAGQPGSVPQT